MKLSFSHSALLIVLVASSASASFTNAWWDKTWHGYQTTNPASVYPVATNVYGRKWVMEWDQVSTTNYIPAWNWGEWYSYGGQDVPFSRNWYWEYKWEFNRETTVPGTITRPDAMSAPLGLHSNSTRSFTIEFVEWLQPDANYYLVYTNYARRNWQSPSGYPAPIGTNVYYLTNTFTVGSTTQHVSSTVSVHTEGVKTNTLLVSGDDLRAYDIYMALRRRWALIYGNLYLDARGFNDAGITSNGINVSYKPVLYREAQESRLYDSIPIDLAPDGAGTTIQPDEWRNLGRCKAFCAAIIGEGAYVDPFATTDSWTEYWGTNLAGAVFPSITVTQALAQAGAPSNYFTHSEYRPFNSPVFYGPEVTQTYTIATSGTGVVTNAVYNYHGGISQAVGTNGQVVTIISTNSDIAAGYTEEDYGWKYLPVIITQSLGWVAAEWSYAVSNEISARSQNAATWGDAITEATNTAWNGDVGMIGTLGEKSAGGFSAFYRSDEITFIVSAPTNIPASITCDADIYVGSKRLASTVTVYDNNGLTDLSEKEYVLYHAFTGIQGSNGVTFGQSSSPGTWCAAPSTGTNTARGFRYQFGSGHQPALLKYTIQD